jgi:hypothetical protein
LVQLASANIIPAPMTPVANDRVLTRWIPFPVNFSERNAARDGCRRPPTGHNANGAVLLPLPSAEQQTARLDGSSRSLGDAEIIIAWRRAKGARHGLSARHKRRTVKKNRSTVC